MDFKVKQIEQVTAAIVELKKLYPNAKDTFIAMLVMLQRVEPRDGQAIANFIKDAPTQLQSSKATKMTYAKELKGEILLAGCKGCGNETLTFVPSVEQPTEPTPDQVEKEIEALFADEQTEIVTTEIKKRGRKKQG